MLFVLIADAKVSERRFLNIFYECHINFFGEARVIYLVGHFISFLLQSRLLKSPREYPTRVIPYRIPLVPDNVPSNNASRSTVPRDHIRLIYNDRRASELYFSPITLEVFIITRYAAPCVYHVNFTRPSSLTTVNNDRALIASERAQITSPTNLSSGARRFHRNSAAIIKIPVYIRHTIRQRRRRRRGGGRGSADPADSKVSRLMSKRPKKSDLGDIRMSLGNSGSRPLRSLAKADRTSNRPKRGTPLGSADIIECRNSLARASADEDTRFRHLTSRSSANRSDTRLLECTNVHLDTCKKIIATMQRCRLSTMIGKSSDPYGGKISLERDPPLTTQRINDLRPLSWAATARRLSRFASHAMQAWCIIDRG